MVEGIFEQSLSAAYRLAAVRAATIVALYELPPDTRSDLEQEALLELWRKRQAYDPRRASWRTFSDRPPGISIAEDIVAGSATAVIV